MTACIAARSKLIINVCIYCLNNNRGKAYFHYCSKIVIHTIAIYVDSFRKHACSKYVLLTDFIFMNLYKDLIFSGDNQIVHMITFMHRFYFQSFERI